MTTVPTEALDAKRLSWAHDAGEGWQLDVTSSGFELAPAELAAMATTNSNMSCCKISMLDGPFCNSSFRVRVPILKNMLNDIMDDWEQKTGCRPCWKSFIVNLNESNEYAMHKTCFGPTLLTSSRLYDIIAEREVLPLQHVLMQGAPVPGLCAEYLSKYFPFPDITLLMPGSNLNDTNVVQQQLSDNEIRRLAGNSFHWAAVGAMLMLILSTSELEG